RWGNCRRIPLPRNELWTLMPRIIPARSTRPDGLRVITFTLARKVLSADPTARPTPPPGRVPRVARLLALAIKFDCLIRDGAVSASTAMARLGHVSTARVTQIMNLVLLAPDIQEEILFLTRTLRGRDPIRPHHLQGASNPKSRRGAQLQEAA